MLREKIVQTIYIPTVEDNNLGYRDLFSLYNRLINKDFDMKLDFSRCRFFAHNAICFIGGMARLIASKGRNVHFLWDTMKEQLHMTLRQNGFRDSFEGDCCSWSGTTIPYKEYAIDNNKNMPLNEINQYLSEEWLGKNAVSLSKSLSNALKGRVLEIYQNAFEHSSSKNGFYCCGQHYPTLNKLSLCIIDFGVGIPYNVKKYENDFSISSDIAMKKAFQKGYTTSKCSGPRGAGLDVLKEFIKINKGVLCVYSLDGKAEVKDQKESYTINNNNFAGTLLNISIKCDGKHYEFKNENKGA